MQIFGLSSGTKKKRSKAEKKYYNKTMFLTLNMPTLLRFRFSYCYALCLPAPHMYMQELSKYNKKHFEYDYM